MVPSARPMEPMRVFFALPLPPEAREQLASMRDRAVAGLGPETIRPIKTENFHITLHFLGDRTEAEITAAGQALDRLSRKLPAPTIGFGAPGVFPRRGAPRVLWQSVEEGAAEVSAIQQALGAELSKDGFTLEDRAFHPHVTLGYVRKGVGRLGQKKVTSWIESAGTPPSESFRVSGVTFVRSRIEEGGAHYTSLAEIDLT